MKKLFAILVAVLLLTAPAIVTADNGYYYGDGVHGGYEQSLLPINAVVVNGAVSYHELGASANFVGIQALPMTQSMWGHSAPTYDYDYNYAQAYGGGDYDYYYYNYNYAQAYDHGAYASGYNPYAYHSSSNYIPGNLEISAIQQFQNISVIQFPGGVANMIQSGFQAGTLKITNSVQYNSCN